MWLLVLQMLMGDTFSSKYFQILMKEKTQVPKTEQDAENVWKPVQPHPSSHPSWKCIPALVLTPGSITFICSRMYAD